jgi:hypothetical protein
MLALLFLLLPHLSSSQLDENERIAEYHKRQHKWPPAEAEFTPQTPGWRNLHTRRFQQITRIEDGTAKYNGYMSTVHSALLAPNFTEYGWALTKGPSDLVELLLARLITGINREDTPVELPDTDQGDIRDEYPEELPLMVSIYGLHQRVLDELLPIHEAWSNTKLIGNNAYGLRVYRNQSNLQMHIDESATHIISSIMHIGHDPDGEPWPLVVEDLHGNTHEVFLETGDVLLYESSKCFHGRPKRYNGKWYSSIFTHYYPADWNPKRNEMNVHYRIPPGWHLQPEEVVEDLDELIVTETSFKEPGCEHEWCALKKTTKWTMPQELQHGQIISSDGVIKPLVKESEDEL